MTVYRLDIVPARDGRGLIGGMPDPQRTFDDAIARARQQPPTPGGQASGAPTDGNGSPGPSAERRRQIDDWLTHKGDNDLGSSFLPWARNGGDKVAAALRGQSDLGRMSGGEQKYLIEQSAVKWAKDGDESSASSLARSRVALGNDPAASAAYEKLLEADHYRSLSPAARFAVLAQVEGYPDARSITNLDRLTGRGWFRDGSLADQQRTAKIVAFASQDQTGNAKINNSTLNHVLGDDDLRVAWADIPAPPGIVTYGEASAEKTGPTVRLNSSYVPAGDGLLPALAQVRLAASTGSDYDGAIGDTDAVKKMGEETLSHEVNHILNHDEVSASYRYFMAEYRAWYVGRAAATGRPPSQEDCYGRARFLVTATRGPYGQIGDAFRSANSPDATKIVQFMARILGRDPANATAQLVLYPNQFLDRNGPGRPPERSGPDDPGNLDNH
jgi:hypothetical protein